MAVQVERKFTHISVHVKTSEVGFRQWELLKRCNGIKDCPSSGYTGEDVAQQDEILDKRLFERAEWATGSVCGRIQTTLNSL